MKQKHIILWALFLFISIVLIGCSGGHESTESKSAESVYDTAVSEESNSKMENRSNESEISKEMAASFDSNSNSSANVLSHEDSKNESQSNAQMIIYHANFNIVVEDFKAAKSMLEELVLGKSGYIASSSSRQIDNGQVEGELSIRIPQEHFYEFLNDVEALSIKVHHQSIKGMDVTEEYVDLNSRLKSKEAVEERLLLFLQDAEKTEDLLKISADLGRIQEEMEQIKGRIKYLQNQVSLSTVEITFAENKIIIPSIDNSELNTWEKTKKQFFTSIQQILSFFSSIFIFLIGNSPMLIMLAVLFSLVYFIYRRNRYKGRIKSNDENI